MIRFIISLLARIFKPEFYKILSPFSTFITLDDMYGNPKYNLVTVEILEGDLNVQKAKEKYSSLTLQTRCFITRWAGFPFWEKDPNFNINNHFSVYNNLSSKPVDEKRLHEIKLELLDKPHTPKRSPWSVLVVKNFKPDKTLDHYPVDDNKQYTAVLLHLHHCLADGFSIMKNFEEPLLTQIGNSKDTSVARKLLACENVKNTNVTNLLKIIFIGPIQVIIDRILHKDDHDWSYSRLKYARECFSTMPLSIPLDYVKNLKNKWGVTFSSVVYASTAGAIRKFMVKQGKTVPEFIYVMTPELLPGHPDNECTNHFGVGNVKLPVGELDPKRRLKLIEDQLSKRQAGSSFLGQCRFYLIGFLGHFPRSMMEFLSRNSEAKVGCVSITSIGYFPTDVYKFGLKQVHFSFIAGMLMHHYAQGLGIALIGTKNRLNIAIRADKTVLRSQKELDDFKDCIVNELKLLENLA